MKSRFTFCAIAVLLVATLAWANCLELTGDGGASLHLTPPASAGATC